MISFIKSIFVGFILLVFNTAAHACPSCRASVKSEVYDQDFFNNLLVILLPIIVLTAIGFGLYHADTISDKLKGGIK